jgi:membrane-bound lytic murein transglycosylase B
MHTKLLATVASVVVYCMVLVAFRQTDDISRMRCQRLAEQAIASWDVGSFVDALSSAVQSDRAQRALAMASEDEERPAEVACDPLLCQTIREFNADISPEGSERLASLIEGTAEMYGVDPYLVAALISQESAFYSNAVSPVGALGYGQLMPETARDLGVDPRDSKENLEGCVKYLAMNLDLWSDAADPVALALASYNAGPGAVEKFGGVPPYQETQNYVAVIKYRYSLLRAGRPAMG